MKSMTSEKRCGDRAHDWADSALWVCVDCLMLAANGETPDGLSEDQTEEWLASLSDDFNGGTTGLTRENHASDCAPDDYDCGCEQEFSWSQCDGCGSSLGGERHGMTVMWCETCSDAETTVYV